MVVYNIDVDRLCKMDAREKIVNGNSLIDPWERWKTKDSHDIDEVMMDNDLGYV